LRLPGIDQPGNLPLLGNIFVYEFFFLRILTVDLFMTIDALGQFGDPGISAVFSEKMAAFTAIFNLFIVQDMVEVNGLLFLGVKKLRENYPSNNETGNQPDNEKQNNRSAGAPFSAVAGSFCFRGRGYRFLIRDLG
jgi:hypothetical protein